MVTEAINAIFSAHETISDALGEAERASESFSRGIKVMNQQLGQVAKASDLSDKELKEFRRTTTRLSLTMGRAKEATEEANDAVQNMGHITDLTSKDIDNIERSLEQAANANYQMERAMDNVIKEQEQLIASNKIAEGRVNQFRNATANAIGPAMLFSDAMSEVTDEVYGVAPAATVAQSSLNRLENELDETRNSSLGAAAGLTTLNSVISESILNFGSLSVNIGPFNIALRNFITQVPAILTGMGSMISLITALIAGFGTLAVVSGTLVAGGALAFFEEFSGQFEDSAKAVQALGAALKNLFIEALEPVMNEANADLFIDVVNGMAEQVNRFAQFANQMRDEVMDVFSQLSGDADDFYNALRNSFVLLEPVLVGFINFFLQDFPRILERFAVLSKNLAGNINILLETFGMLLNELLDLSATILAGVAPAVQQLVGILTVLAGILNMVPGRVLSVAISVGILSIAALKAIGAVAGLGAGLVNLQASLIGAAASGSTAAAAISSFGLLAKNAALDVISFDTAIDAATVSLKFHRGQLWKTITAHWAMLKTIVANIAGWVSLSGAINVATGAVTTFLSTISLGIIPAIVILIGIISAVIAVIMNWGGIMDWITGIFNFFKNIIVGILQILAGILIPVINLVIAVFQAWGQFIGWIVEQIGNFITKILSLLGVMDKLEGGGSFFEQVLDWLGGWNDLINMFIQQLNKIPGVDISGPAMDVAEVQRSLEGNGDDRMEDEIETNPNVNLSFKDELNQQVDVQADPEDKEGLRRIVKDAMNEANSISRRSNGVGR